MISINERPTSDNSLTSGGQRDSSGWSIGRLLKWTTDYFGRHGHDQPRLDAEVLLAEALGCQRIELYTRFEDEPTDAERTQFRDWVRRHGDGEPVAYLVGHKEFFSLKLEVNRDVLIPRPETEHVVSEALDIVRKLSAKNDIVWVADVGTGCGNIAIALAQHAFDVRIVATDTSQAALELARRNAQVHDALDAITFVRSDLLSNADEPRSFDLIVSNPPYVGLDEEDQLDRSVVEFEPRQALFAEGRKGTETIERLIGQAADRLKSNGYLVFEISPMIAAECRRLIEQSSLTLSGIAKDLAGLERVVIAQRN